MKKNRMMRLASVLLVLCLLTTSVISGTFAKYTSSATATDSARVAKWSVLVNNTDIAGTTTKTLDIDLFSTVLDTKTGDKETDIKQNDGTLIAPGTTVSYDLRLRNNDDVVIDFLMTPTVEFLTGDAVPVEFKMVDSYGNYILGSDTQWATADDMNALNHKGSIHPGEAFTYHITWQWVFEVDDEQDAYDTYLGVQDGEILPGIRVGIETQSSVNPTPVDNNHMMHLFGEGFGCCWCYWLVWLLLLVIIVMVIWIWRLKKKLKKLEEVIDEYEETMLPNGVGMNT